MLLSPLRSSYVAWGVWMLSWLVAAGWSARVAKRPMFGAQTLYTLITIVGVILLFNYNDGHHSLHGVIGWLLFAAVVSGFLFCWWARVHLGSLWSGTVTRKDDHHIVDTGPYGLVRHPIYTGLILSAFGQ